MAPGHPALAALRSGPQLVVVRELHLSFAKPAENFRACMYPFGLRSCTPNLTNCTHIPPQIPSHGCALVKATSHRGKEKGRKLVEATGLICGGAGITNHAAGRMDSVFFGNEFKKYRQKYRHFPVCPVCGEDETLSYDLTGNGP